jgi:hypothetical protein
MPSPEENENDNRESVETRFDALHGGSKETDLIANKMIDEQSPGVLLPKGVAGNRDCSIDGY